MSLSKNISFVRRAGLCAAFLISGVAAAAPANAPFKARVDPVFEVLTFNPGSATCPFSGLSTGIGSASYLGPVVLTANDCVIPLPGNAGFAFQGKFVLTAANGDMVFATYSGKFVPTQPGSLTYMIVDGMYSITGGTGRYLGATGSGTLSGTETVTFDPVTHLPKSGTGVFNALGKISLPSDNSQNQQGQNQQGQQGQNQQGQNQQGQNQQGQQNN